MQGTRIRMGWMDAGSFGVPHLAAGGAAATGYVELLNRDLTLAPVRGCLAAQSITPQARVLAEDRGIECVVVDYEALRGVDDPDSRLF